ncbi:hypothetical protein HMI54_014644 [Coelomomyces lativittatus]|nr:hypothetical protein HMI54_014644 [Coelomomyces lativittatus]
MKAHMWEETNRLTHQQLREHQGMEFMIRELQFRQTTNTSILRHHFNTARIASRNKENLQLEIRTQKSREVALIEAWAALEKKTKQSRQEVDEFYLNKAVLETPPSLFICEKLIATFELAKDHLVGMESGHYTEQDFQQFLSSKGDKGEKSTNSLFAVQDPQIIRDQLKKAEQDLKALTHAHAQQLSQLKKKLEEEFAELVRKIQKEYNALKLSQLEARQNLERVQEEELIHLRSAHEKESQMSDSIMKSEHTMLLERKRLNLMLQGIADGIITIDNAGIILRFNSSAERIFGYTSKEIMGKNVKMLQPTYIAENHDSYLKNYLETGIYKVIGTRRTTLGRKKDGVEFPIKLSVSEVKGDGVHLFTGIIHDLTKETLQIETDKKEVEKRKLEMESLIQQLAVERGRSTDLVNAILPQSISQRLLQDGTVPPEKFNDVTVLFTEISGYSEIVTKYSAMDIVDLLNELYCTFDEVILNYDVYKVETIGDSYVCASGVPTPNKNHAVEIAKLALHFQKAIQYVKMKNYPEVELKLKIGIHSGPLVAGIVGLKCPRYCLFGDTVNTASRMKSVCEPCKINLSHATYQLLAGVDMKPFLMTARGDIAVKGKGAMQTFYLDSMIGLKLSMASVKQMKIADSLKYESTQLEDSNASVNIKQDYKQERHAFSQ